MLPTATHRASDFLAAAADLGVEVVVGSERRQAMAAAMGDRAAVVPLRPPGAALEAIIALHARAPVDAVLAVDDQGVQVAALAAERLGFRHNPPGAVAATRDKAVMRRLLGRSGVPQPAFRVVDPGGDVAAAAVALGFPCVVKPVSRSGSQGVIRVDHAAGAREAADRVAAIVRSAGCPPEPLLVERFVPGREVALEGILSDGHLHVLAVFDKPDPLDGPFFEETVYVTPSRLGSGLLARVGAVAADAARALGLREGPVHAEVRLADGSGTPFGVAGDGTGGHDGGTTGGATVIELAARSIGGLCARTLRFGAGVRLEEVIIRHALGMDLGPLAREAGASGVMMLPIRAGGILERVSGRDEALAVPGVVGLEITVAPGKPLVPLPDGDRYLGFVFARGPDPEAVVHALRQAESRLTVQVRDH